MKWSTGKCPHIKALSPHSETHLITNALGDPQISAHLYQPAASNRAHDMTPKNFKLAQWRRELTFLDDDVYNDDRKLMVLFTFQQLITMNLLISSFFIRICIKKTCLLFLKHPFWDSPFCLITYEVMPSTRKTKYKG